MQSSPSFGSLLLPPAASTVAGDVDGLLGFINWVSIFFFVLVVAIMVFFVVVYRRREGAPKVKQITHNTALEILWTGIPFLITMIIFFWGARTFMGMQLAPKGAIEIQVTAKQWVWDFEYPGGARSTNELHVPVNQPIKLVMSSVDVIHSFYIPDFRIKQDVVPGRYTTAWFQAPQAGEHVLFCTEYCGTSHSNMLARIVVEPQADYQKFLEAASASNDDLPLTELGAKLLQQKACQGCHSLDGSPLVGPSFKGVFGRTEKFMDGSSGVVDENYLRQSIMDPQAKIVVGFQPVMPTFQGQLSDREVNGIIEYLKTVK